MTMISDAIVHLRWRAAAAKRLRATLAALERPAVTNRTDVVGANPLRVLILGAGVFAGYGVTSWTESLGGQLAQALSADLHRGVIVHRRLLPNAPVAQLQELLGEVGAHTYDLVLWSPSFDETVRGFTPPQWRRTASRLFTTLHDSSNGRAVIVAVRVPVPSGASPADCAIVRSVHAINRHLDMVTSSHTHVIELTPPGLEGSLLTTQPPAMTSHFYRRAAMHLAPQIAQRIRTRQSWPAR